MEDQRRLIHDALVRAATFAGADVRELVSLGKEPLSAFAACCFVWRDREAKAEVHMPPVPSDPIRKHYSLVENADVTSFFYDAFWIALYVGLRANGSDFSMIYPGLGKKNLGWLVRGLGIIEKIAKEIAEARIAPTFSAVYTESADIERVSGVHLPRRNTDNIWLSRRLSDTLPSICISLLLPTPVIRRCQPQS